jgi:hypothetical protein
MSTCGLHFQGIVFDVNMSTCRTLFQSLVSNVDLSTSFSRYLVSTFFFFFFRFPKSICNHFCSISRWELFSIVDLFHVIRYIEGTLSCGTLNSECVHWSEGTTFPYILVNPLRSLVYFTFIIFLTQTDRQTDQTDRQTNKQTDRQTFFISSMR